MHFQCKMHVTLQAHFSRIYWRWFTSRNLYNGVIQQLGKSAEFYVLFISMSLIFFYTVNCVKLAAEFFWRNSVPILSATGSILTWELALHSLHIPVFWGKSAFPNFFYNENKGMGECPHLDYQCERETCLFVYFWYFGSSAAAATPLSAWRILCPGSHSCWGSFWKGQCAVGWGPRVLRWSLSHCGISPAGLTG